MVGLSQYLPERFQHKLAGGKRQQVGTAREIFLRPEFIVAD